MELQLLSDIILVVFSLIFLIPAVISDFKFRNVKDWISVSLFFIALIIRLVVASFTEWSYLYNSLIVFGIMIIVSLIFYYGLRFGGGDMKIILALTMVFGTNPLFLRYFSKTNFDLIQNLFGIQEPFIITFIINFLVIGALYGLICIFVKAIQHKKEFLEKFREENKKIIIFKVLFLVLAVISLVFFVYLGINQFMIITLILLLVPYLLALSKTYEQFNIKEIDVKKLEIGDWLIKPIIINENKVEIKINTKLEGLTEKQLKLIQKHKIHEKILVKDGIPAMHSIFLSIIMSIIFGDLLIKLIYSLL